MDGTLGAVLTAITEIAEPARILFLLGGVLLGLMIGAIPGLGGLVGMTLLLPFTFHMDPYAALAMLIGMHAVVSTSDSIPAILFGVPGTVGSAATVMDGYPMSRNGEAGRALGAAFTASMLGGIFGAVMLAIAIPVMRPFMLSIGSPEMLAFCIFGISLAAALSGKFMLRGLAMAALGLMLSMVGEDYQSGTMRWTFGTLYLWEGIPLVPLALGLFALPEIADLAVRRSKIASGAQTNTHGLWKGVVDVLRNPQVFLRSAFIGSVLGALPGLGSSVIDWIAYGSTARSGKKDGKFGQGDVRGVIASEAANNAKEGGALVPTIAFGVPGSAAMSILLGAFLVQGIVPGPAMLNEKLDLTYTLIISLALANVVGAGICVLLSPWLARVAMVPVAMLAPLVIAITFVGALQAEHHWGDLVVLLVSGVVGYLMRLLGWPRPPLLLGFVLGVLIERYLATSVQVYGAGFLGRPVVVIMLALTAWGLLFPVARRLLQARRSAETKGLGATIGFRSDRFDIDTALAGGIAVIFAAALIDMSDWSLGARLMPQSVGVIGLVLVLLYLVRRLFVTPHRQPDHDGPHLDLAIDRGGLDRAAFLSRVASYFLWLFGLAALAYLIGVELAVPVWVLAYMRLGFGLSWLRSAIAAAIMGIAVYALFDMIVHTIWPQPLIVLF
jgi:TctA family transporter